MARYFVRPPFEIEDLLTAAVFGACSYVDADVALLPFVGAARDEHGARLKDLLADVTEVLYSFWDRSLGDGSGPDMAPSDELTAPGAEPELVLRFRRKKGPELLLLIEAKLLSGKSSFPSEGGPVTDQLGKYWLRLRTEAARTGAVALGVVYVTRGMAFPFDEFVETQTELEEKEAPRAPLYWLSWRAFGEHVAPEARRNHRVLAEVSQLLDEHWGLAPVRPMEPWAAAPMNHSPWSFQDVWAWVGPPGPSLPWTFGLRFDWPVTHPPTRSWTYEEG
ncbi:hypothetical protein LY474_22255 [Myxococcus stipitatus]|uniref:hypothetical protein n=1 Tax=Myxococcus stipitatus TaxID=83455 RepID=UPI001F3AAA7D|nr:hypothetical protein [Myxococcus stipitatus]MCE9670531.1 hypothetical protein [Myxococcus stipitatus]